MSGVAVATEPGLAQKIAQLLVMGFDGTAVDAQSPIVTAIQRYGLGGVVLFDYNTRAKTYQKNIESPSQVAALNHALQAFAAKVGHPPLLIGVDYEGGTVSRLKPAYGFPETLSAEQIASLPESEALRLANQMAQTLVESGFNLNFAPDADVNINPDNPIIGARGRSFSAQPTVVGDYARLFGQVYGQHGVVCALKHFPGHGSAGADSHLGLVDVSDTWQSAELIPFKMAAADCPMIMTAHVINRQLDASGLPATLSYAMLSQVLRQQLGFKGVIISDDLQMAAIADQFGLDQALVMAFNAGNDMVIIANMLGDPVTVEAVIESLVHHVEDGDIPPARIDEAYQRVMALKMNGLQYP